MSRRHFAARNLDEEMPRFLPTIYMPHFSAEHCRVGLNVEGDYNIVSDYYRTRNVDVPIRIRGYGGGRYSFRTLDLERDRERARTERK